MRLFEKQQLIIIALAIAVVFGFVFLRYIPLAKRTQEIKQSKVRYSEENLKVKDQVQRLPLIVSKTEQLQSKVGDFDRKVPVVREFGPLWDQIAAMMNEFGLKEQLIQPQTEVKGSELCLIPINMECSGNLRDIFSFFKSLEDFDRVIRIESLSMSGINSADGGGEVKMIANANVYYRPFGSVTSVGGR